MFSCRRPHARLRPRRAPDARHHARWRNGAARSHSQLQLHELPVSPPPPRRTRHIAGRRILFNQVPHQIDTARLLAGGVVQERARQTTVLDPARPTEAGCAALLQFESGATASLVYSGYELRHRRVALRPEGARRAEAAGAGGARRSLAQAADETRARTEAFAYGQHAAALPPHQPHFGITIVDLRREAICAPPQTASRLWSGRYARDAIPRGGSMPGRREVLDDIRTAIVTGRRPSMTVAGARRPSRSRWPSCVCG